MENEQSYRFQDLPRELKLEILSRLPVVYIPRCGEVCQDWKAVLSASSDPSPPSVFSLDFLKNFWIQNRPKERWLFLINKSVFGKVLLYDVTNQVCYRWCPFSSVSRQFQLWAKMQGRLLFLLKDLRIWNTTSNGLLFLVDGLDFNHAKTRIHGIWTCNPLTGYVTKLPAICGNSVVAAALVANDDRTTRSEPHYNVLLIESSVDIVPPAKDNESKIHLYSSKEKRWKTQESIDIHPTSKVEVVTRFSEHDLIYFIVYPSTGQMLNAFEIQNWELKWLHIQEDIWYSCSLSPIRDLDHLSLRGTNYVTPLEWNKHFIFVATFTAMPLQVRVYKSLAPITNGMECSWMLLSTMPADVIPGPHPEVACPHFKLGFQVHPRVSAFSDKIEGDKIILIFVGVKSYAMVCFNLEKPAQDAWKCLVYSTDLTNEQPLTQFDEKIATWSKPCVLDLVFPYRSIGNTQPDFETIGSIGAFTFEPRLDNARRVVEL